MAKFGKSLCNKKPRREAGSFVEIDEIIWNRITDYVFKWYPILTKNDSQGFIQR